MLHNRMIFMLLAVLALTLIVSGCQPTVTASDVAATQPETEGAVPAVTFTAVDYRYSGPDSIPAGLTDIRLENAGTDAHHIQLLKLEEGKTIEDLTATLAESPVWPEWTQAYGGPNAVFPGSSSNAFVPLDPGEYVVLSWAPDMASGAPQYQRGMIQPLSVTESGAATAELTADITLDLVDFSFVLSAIPAAGTQTIRVNNAGHQPHEVLLVKLPADATPMDFVASIGTDTLRGELAGGITEIEPGMYNLFTATFESGVKYGLLCFVMDPETGQPHFMQGMSQEFVVQ